MEKVKARSFEAIYTDWIGREILRELLVNTGLGAPTAVQHRDGKLYVLVAEGDHHGVYREVPQQPMASAPAPQLAPHSAVARMSLVN